MTLAQSFPRETCTIFINWYWCICSKLTLARLFPSETSTTVSKWDWYDCSQVTLAWLLRSVTFMIVLKWDWHNCSQVRLTPLFPSGFWISKLYFVLFFGNDSSLVRFTWEQLYHVPGLGRMITYYILAIDIFCKLVEVLKDQLYQLLRAVLRGKNRSMTLGLGCWILPV